MNNKRHKEGRSEDEQTARDAAASRVLVVEASLYQTLSAMQRAKPGDRSPEDRHFAIMLTELEKLIAYFAFYVKGRGIMAVGRDGDK